MTRIAVVTGATGGIGGACAARLASDGMEVVWIDRNRPEKSVSGHFIQHDLGDLESLPSLMAQIEAEIGSVDVLVNSAAIFKPVSMASFQVSDLDETLRINLEAGVILSVLAGRRMAERGWGRVILISSVHARLGEKEALAYDIAKGGLEQAGRTLAVELSGSGVLVNSVALGFVRSGLSIVKGVDELASSWFRQNFIENGRLPVGRPAEPEEVARLVAWLASEENSYMTGSVLTLDGGMTGAL